MSELAPNFGRQAGLNPAALPLADKLRVAREFIEREGLDWPVVLKPDAGQRGSGVAVVRSQDEVEAYLGAIRADAVIQEHCAGEEFGVFYYRYPDAERGEIFAVTTKHFPEVVGDGRSTLERLILADDRAVCLARLFLERHAGRLWDVPAAGVRVRLGEIGNHCRGAVFRDGTALASEGMRAARAEAEQARTKLAEARSVYGPRHPKVAALQSEADAAAARLKDESRSAASDLSSERSMHSMREGALGAELARATDQLASVQSRTKRMSVEESELAVDQELYSRLISRAHQMGFERQLATATVAVAEPASVDPSPVRPRRLLTFVVSIVTGLLVGLGFALLGDSNGRTIRSPGDAEAQLDLPVLGQIHRNA